MDEPTVNPIALGPFALLHPLGAGGMGEVWKGRHTATHVPVAIKVITSHHARDRRHREVLANEVRAVAALDHPGIVHVFDQGDVDAPAAQASGGKLVEGSPYLAMEFARGSLDGAPPLSSWEEVSNTLVALLDALAHAHARGVVHRDLKPGNVLVFDGGRIAIADFGLAHALTGDDATVAHGGTPSYMAPEQVRGRWREFGPWTDLYALACMGWGLVCGRPPFDGTVTQLRLAHQHAEPPPLRSRLAIPAGFEAWLARGLEKDPSQRFRCAADARFALEALGEPDPTLINPIPEHEQPDQSRTVAWGTDPNDPPSEATYVESAPTPSRPSSPRRRPPMPPGGSRAGATRPDMALVGAGLGLYGLRTVPLVDRDTERDALWQGLRDVQKGGVRVIVLSGAPGIGKSRLLRWICERASETGCAVPIPTRHGASDPPDALRRSIARALGVVRDTPAATARALERHLRSNGVQDPWEWRAAASLLIPDAPSDVDLTPNEAHAVLWRLARRAGDAFDGDPPRPLLFAVDNAAAGPESVAFVTWLARQQDAAALVVLTARTDDGADDGLPKGTRLEVGALAEADRHALVSGLLGLEGELAEQVVRRTEGNPLFAEQLVGDWVQRGVLDVGATGFILRTGARADLPDDLHAMWRTRLVRVAGDGDGAMQLAALLGTDVDAALLEDAARRAAVPIPDDLVSRLLDAGLITAAERGFTFTHGMLRESLERSAREGASHARLRSACADALLASDAHPRGFAERVAAHLVLAGRTDEAIHWLLVAAEERRATSDPHGALALLDRRDALLPSADARRTDGELARGWCFVASGRLAEARTIGLQLRHLAAGCRLAAAAARKQGEFDAADALLREAEPLTSDPVERSPILRARADVARQRGQLTESLALYDRALAEGPIGRDRADVLYGLAAGRCAHRDFDACERYATEAIEVFAALGSRFGEAACHNLLGEIWRGRGHLAEATSAYERAERLLTSIGSVDRLVARMNRGIVLFADGRIDVAEAAFESALHDATLARRKVLETGAHVLLVACAARQRRQAPFALHLAHAVRLLGETGAADRDLAEALAGATEDAAAAGWPVADVGALTLAQAARLDAPDLAARARQVLSPGPALG